MRYIFLFSILAATFTATAEQLLPPDLRCMPVLIEIPLQDHIHSSIGTGIYLDDSNAIYLATAAHCIFNVESTNRSELINTIAFISSYVRGNDLNAKCIFKLNLKLLNDRGMIKRHTHDVAIIRLLKYVNSNNSQVVRYDKEDTQPLTPPTSSPVPFYTNDTCIFENIQDGNEIIIFGHPVELLNTNIQPEIDFSHALIRRGSILQRNQNTHKLIIDTGVYGGNSGGPVLTIEHSSLIETDYKIAGFVTQFVPVFT